MSEEKEPIVFMLPESLKDRKFTIMFDPFIKDLKEMKIMDMDRIKGKKPILGSGCYLVIDGRKIKPLKQEYHCLMNEKY